MNRKKLLALYSLKWNPFSPDLPLEAVVLTPRMEDFCWRVQNLVEEGGFALITGDPGTGKSVVLRKLAQRLADMRDVRVGTLTRPQSRVADFYRELGDIFDVKVTASNRWGGFKVLREKWRAHLEASLVHPVLLVDEAQQMPSEVLSEVRLLSSTDFDSTLLLTVVLCGDSRLPEKFRQEELVPLGSRIRTRLQMDYLSREELLAFLKEATAKAGNRHLMTPELMATLAEHAMGNYRVLATMASELLVTGVAQEAHQLDEKLYFEVFGGQMKDGRRSTAKKERAMRASSRKSTR